MKYFIVMIIILGFIPCQGFAQSELEAVSLHFWGGFDLINGHVNTTTSFGSASSFGNHTSAGGFGGGMDLLFHLDKEFGIGIETGYFITDVVSNAYPTNDYVEGIFPLIAIAQWRLVGAPGHHSLSLQGGVGIGLLYQTRADINGMMISTSIQQTEKGLLGFIGPSAEIALTRWFCLQATARYYFTSLSTSEKSGMLYITGGIGFTF